MTDRGTRIPTPPVVNGRRLPIRPTYCINVFQVLARREISPTRRRVRRKFYRKPSKRGRYQEIDTRSALYSWVEAEYFDYVSVSNCDLEPQPQATLFIAFSPDGTMVASAHKDLTIRIIDYESRVCKRILIGHRQSPWMVVFHPTCSSILASSGVDGQVRIWNVDTSTCIAVLFFKIGINAIAFHPQEELLAIAAGHEIYIWNYVQVEHPPAIVLTSHVPFSTVQFHPRAAPLLVTTEAYAQYTDRSARLEPSSTHVRYCGRHSSPPTTDEERQARNNLEQHRLLFPSIQSWLMRQTRVDPKKVMYLRGKPTADSSLSTVALVRENGFLQYTIIPESFRGSFDHLLDPEIHLPSTAQLTIWPYDARSPYAPIQRTMARLTVSHVIIGRCATAWGVHLSPCGRFMVTCVTSALPRGTCTCADDKPLTGDMYTVTLAGDRIVYELRVYSVEEATFGLILVSRQMDAASSLTSLQFSPTSEHILVGYRQFHKALDSGSYLGETIRIRFYTVIEAYRVRDLAEITVALSCRDHVKVAHFHPHATSPGIAYGNMNGSVRFLRMDHRDQAETVCVAISELQEESEIRYAYNVELLRRIGA